MPKTDNWSLHTLRKHILSIIEGVRLEYRQQFRSIAKANKLALSGQKILDQKNNEFRSQLDRQADTFASKTDVQSQVKSLSETLNQYRGLSDERKEAFDKQISTINLSLKDSVTKIDLETRLSTMQSQIDSLDASRNQNQGQAKQQERSTGNNQWLVVVIIGLIVSLPSWILEITHLVTGK